MHMGSSPDNYFGGFSIGASLGYVQGNGDTQVIPLPNAAEFFNLEPQTLLLHPHGVIGGLRAGYDIQHNKWVFGLLADFSGSGTTMTAKESPIIQSDGTPFPGAGFLSAKEETKWFSTIRVRTGFVVDKRVLFYVTGGFAWARVIYGADTSFPPGGDEVYSTQLNRIRGGWTAGAGVQYAIHRHWSAGAEYLYYEFTPVGKTVNGNPLDPPFQVGYIWATEGQIAQGVLSYRF
jgi:outer membrane immunogenic protein